VQNLENQIIWFGADPGGQNSFGTAILHKNGSFETGITSYTDETMQWLLTRVEEQKLTPVSAGIDAPLWWSSGRAGERKVDRILQDEFGISHSTAQSINSLRGAVLVQGIMLAIRLREKFSSIEITEAHPKALLRFLEFHKKPDEWNKLSNRFLLIGDKPRTEHERDALICAICAREGYQKKWKRNLSDHRLLAEQDIDHSFFGPTDYWWPDK
jgi:predicted nuclease with RNAse H fold